jgi:DNA-binding NtrC family response regulator
MLKSFPPDALISDVVLSGMSGVELAHRVAERLPSCKILLISGDISSFDGAENRGGDGNLFTIPLKPIHPKEILAFVANCAPQEKTNSE